ncbi:MAG: hypothetical protein KJ879_02055 [Nanoarchaeota archaeon]|nr:hypothetical protein [Nanoarchaeota archaeon]
MEDEMRLYYDEKGDFLEIVSGDISNCYFENIGKGIFKITDKTTGEVKGISIHSFKNRSKNLDEIKINLPLKFKIFS